MLGSLTQLGRGLVHVKGMAGGPGVSRRARGPPSAVAQLWVVAPKGGPGSKGFPGGLPLGLVTLLRQVL